MMVNPFIIRPIIINQNFISHPNPHLNLDPNPHLNHRPNLNHHLSLHPIIIINQSFINLPLIIKN
jgi:hypothetical protein